LAGWPIAVEGASAHGVKASPARSALSPSPGSPPRSAARRSTRRGRLRRRGRGQAALPDDSCAPPIRASCSACT